MNLFTNLFKINQIIKSFTQEKNNKNIILELIIYIL